MVAYDSRRQPDPSELLHPDTVARLRAALVEQRNAGPDPLPALSAAIESAAHEARARDLRPEALIIQLKQLAEDVGMRVAAPGFGPRGIQDWMVQACLRAYWNENPESESENEA